VTVFAIGLCRGDVWMSPLIERKKISLGQKSSQSGQFVLFLLLLLF